MNITSWWDLCSEEKAQLTEEQVRSYCQVAAMEAGCVLTVADPVFLPENLPPLETQTHFAIDVENLSSSILFATREDAETFARLGILGVSRKYMGQGYAASIDVVTPLTGMTVKLKDDCVSETEYERARLTLDEYGDNVRHNKELRDELNKRSSAYERATRDIWEDYRDSKKKLAKLEEVRVCWDEYKGLAKDQDSAIIFMNKAYDDAKLLEEALGEGWDLTTTATPESVG